MKVSEILAAGGGLVVLLGLVEWQVSRAMDEPAAVEERVTAHHEADMARSREMATEREQRSRERATWFRREHERKADQLDRIEETLQRMLMGNGGPRSREQ